MKLKKLLMMAAGGEVTYSDLVLGLGPIAYWPLNEMSGTRAVDVVGGNNGTYTGVDLGQSQTPFVAPLFDGSGDYCNLDSTWLRNTFTPNETTVMIWYKPDSGVLADSTFRGIIRFQVDTDNRIYLARSTTNNVFDILWEANNTMEVVSPTIATYTWHQLAITASKTADQVKVYVDGAQSGSTQTGLQTWTGTPTTNLIGAATAVPANVWKGWLAHAALWNRALTAAEVANLYAWGV